MFAIRRKSDGMLATWDYESNGDAEFANSVEIRIDFDKWSPPAFFVAGDAELALKENSPWYNASFQTPSWSTAFRKAVEAGDFEIVEYKPV